MLSAKKVRTNNEQTALQKLFNEQQKILQSGKIVPTISGQNSQGITYVRRHTLILYTYYYYDLNV